jgi:hypothetical protein
VMGGGPSAAFPHLILIVERFTGIAAALGLASVADGLPREVTSNFDRADPCLSGVLLVRVSRVPVHASASASRAP